jgi:hypothetical protein
MSLIHFAVPSIAWRQSARPSVVLIPGQYKKKLNSWFSLFYHALIERLQLSLCRLLVGINPVGGGSFGTKTPFVSAKLLHHRVAQST